MRRGGGGETHSLPSEGLSDRSSPVDADALVPVTLGGNHHVGLVEHEHGDLLRVDEFVFGAPVQDCAWSSNHNLLLQLHASLH